MAKPASDRVRVSGPLAAFADGFFVDLVEHRATGCGRRRRIWSSSRL
jgi:hypothetical protein